MEALDTKIISEKEIETGAEIIRRGGLVIFPTETVYGLGANALDSTASAKIYAAKGRPSDNPLICHLASADDAEKYCAVNEMYKKLAARFMPGPITVILPKKYNENGELIVPDTTTGGLDSVAVRVPSNRIARKLIENRDSPSPLRRQIYRAVPARPLYATCSRICTDALTASSTAGTARSGSNRPSLCPKRTRYICSVPVP